MRFFSSTLFSKARTARPRSASESDLRASFNASRPTTAPGSDAQSSIKTYRPVTAPSDDRGTFSTYRTTTTSADIDEYPHWNCCQCNTENGYLIRTGKHPVGVLICKCLHRACDTCHFTGDLTNFVPIQEPLTVPIPDTGRWKEVPYGTVCQRCGLSWRAQEVQPQYKMSLHHKQRLAPIKGKLQKSQSMMNVSTGHGLLGSSSAKGKEKEQEVQATNIQFTGFKCTCGSIRNAEPEPRHQEPSRATNPELQAMGHQTPVLRIRGVVHANPLRSNPV